MSALSSAIHNVRPRPCRLVAFLNSICKQRGTAAAAPASWLGRSGEHDARAAAGEPIGRIISARKATAHERKAYEEGNF
jgi:hypothetical protein